MPDAPRDLHAFNYKRPRNKPNDGYLWKPTERNSVCASKQLRFVAITETINGNRALGIRCRRKANGKIVFLRLWNLSGQRLKTKESNIPECWRRFKPLAFYACFYHVIQPKTCIWKTMPFYQCELLNELRRQFLNFSSYYFIN